jgi:hypothetical protein
VSTKEKGAEKRINPRAKLSRMLRVRPSEGDADPVEETSYHHERVEARNIFSHQPAKLPCRYAFVRDLPIHIRKRSDEVRILS